MLAERVPSLLKTTNPQVQDAQGTPNWRNIKKIISRSIIIKLFNISDKKKIVIKGYIMYKEANIRMVVNLLSEVMQARRQ